LPNHYENILLDEFVIMPNHFHGIIIIRYHAIEKQKHGLSRDKVAEFKRWVWFKPNKNRLIRALI
jgi:REP element-mobilizing transposase RayT